MKKRLNYLDVIRVFACFCVLTVHFNASISGYDQFLSFVYPNPLIPTNWFGVYLGSLGVGLFFMISGAALEYRYREGCEPLAFYRKRALNLYPAFWIAYLTAFVLNFFINRAMPGAPVWHMLVTALGMDGYCLTMGWNGSGFYILGEWFLGCILLIYLMYPFLSRLFHRLPVLTAAAVAVLWTALTLAGVDYHFFLNQLAYILLGMMFSRYVKSALSGGVLLGTAGLLLVRILCGRWMSQPVLTLVTCALFFLGLAILSELLQKPLDRVSPALRTVSGLTYPIFLVHHWIIGRMVLTFDLATISRRSVALLYVLCIAASAAAGYLLKRVTDRVLERCCRPAR